MVDDRVMVERVESALVWLGRNVFYCANGSFL